MAKIILRGKIWYSDYFANGQRIRKPLSPNRRDAQNMQDELETANRYHANGLIPSQFSWETFKAEYLRYSKTNWSLNTYAHDKLAFERLEELRPIRYLHQITPALLEEGKARWAELGYGPSAIGSYVMRIKVAMKIAEQWDYIRPQAWSKVHDYVSSGRMIYYTTDQFNCCLKLCNGKYKTAFLLAARAGMRSGEIRHLLWEDVLIKEKIIHIRSKPCDVCAECIRDRNIWHPKGWTPKKPHHRIIDMPTDLQVYLESLPRCSSFVMEGDRPISPTRFAAAIKSTIDLAGLRGSAHTLRHTYASWLISSGAVKSLYELGELLGHTNSASTQIYAHLMPHARRRIVDALPPL